MLLAHCERTRDLLSQIDRIWHGGNEPDRRRPGCERVGRRREGPNHIHGHDDPADSL